MNILSRALATGCFVGYVPIAPGTAGSLLGLFLYWLIPASESLLFGLAILLLLFAGVWSARKMEQASGIKDDQIIVIDEIAGMWISLFAVQKELKWLAIGFIFFRLFDVVKPFPVKRLEKWPGGWGVMADDLVAGIYAAICVRMLLLLTAN